MKTSARNQFAGTISRIEHGTVNDEVELELAGGQKIVAMITCASTKRLALAVGSSAVALVKASSVILSVDEGMRFSTRNTLSGTVSAVQAGAVNAEVIIDLAGGNQVAAIVTLNSSEALGLTTGKPVTAIFKASSVILGVSA